MGPTLLILKIYTTFKDVQMMLELFFDTSTGFSLRDFNEYWKLLHATTMKHRSLGY